MAKKRNATAKREKPSATATVATTRTAAAQGSGWLSARTLRESVESVAVAFILAFLFRGFEAEAFVIPTGSMAPTLMGAHKDVVCPQCGYQYRAGASSEEDQFAQQMNRTHVPVPVMTACCPMCRFTENVGPGTDHPTYGGDRILVSKFIYEFQEPERWDVIVFKYPAEAQTNFIKRCVGLPGETIRIFHGDLHVRPPEGKEFAIPRRRPEELRAMAQIVYDNDYVVDAMTKAGWPLRWQAMPSATGSSESSFKSDDGGRSFATRGSAGQTEWLRYRHFVPSLDDWQALRRGRAPADAKPLLITDFYAYNASIQRNQSSAQPQLLGLHWVGDLMLECELESTDGKGAAHLDLVKGGRHFRCQIDCATGEARLSIDGLKGYAPKAQTDAAGLGSHHVVFANIDRQLVLWIDGWPVQFDAPTTYEPLDNDLPQSTPDDPLDLAPAGVGSEGAGLAVRHLKLWRDLYYVAARSAVFRMPSDYGDQALISSMSYSQLYRFWSTPALWNKDGGPSPFAERRAEEFPLEPGQFFMLGDNSPASSDARLWPDEKFVPRELLTGKALVIFWPHSFNRIPGTDIPFPFFPNFARMGFIR
jgi:signal peptidase I